MPSRSLILPMLLVLSAACGRLAPPLLSGLQEVPPPPSPEQRDLANRLDIHYHLSAPATISSRIVAADGTQWVIHTDAPRPTSGDYVLQFDGTIAGPGPNERRVLPDGQYQVVLDAQTSGHDRQQEQVPLTVRAADTRPPAIDDLALLPDRISPNFDARDDVTHVTYRLAKDALVSPFLDRPSPPGAPTRVWTGEEQKTVAGEQSATWDGIANGQPVASGDYVFGIRARDTAGNVVERGQPLSVEDSGVPEASIVTASIGPLQIIRGGEVCLDTLVRNTGQTILRTQGPDPGYVYNSFDTYASIENHSFSEHAGFWRVGLNWSGSTDISGASYPYRWGFGHDLQPGEEATVHGCVKVLNEQDKLVYFAGLVQENVAIRGAGAGLVRISISS